MSKIYAGSIPPQGGKMVYPESVDEGNSYEKPEPGPSEVSATKGGPGTPHGSSNTGDFIGKESYDGPGDMEPGTMKIRDLNDISNQA